MVVDPASLVIVHYPDPALRVNARPIETIDENVRVVAHRMVELMHEAEGVGLAAPQVGLSWRLFVCRGIEEDDPEMVVVNPELELHRGDLVPHEEGCLSLPGITAEIRRPARVTLTALDLAGEKIHVEHDDFIARIWQHEFDHLNGVLIIDRMSRIDRMANRKSLKALESVS